MSTIPSDHRAPSPDGTTDAVSVVIPTFGRRREVIWALDSLYTAGLAEGPADFEVLVVEQADAAGQYAFPEAEARALKARHAALRWLRCPVANLPLARMVALDAATKPTLLYLDDDILCGPGLVARHAQALARTGAAAVVGRILSLDGRRHRTRPARISRLTGRQTGGWDLGEEARGDAATLAGGNMSIRTDALRQVGGFSRAFEQVAVREEADVAEKLKKAGRRIYYEPSAFIVHLRAPAGGCRPASRDEEAYWAKRCDSHFLWTHYPRATWLSFLATNALYHLLFRPAQLRQAVAGILDGRHPPPPTSATSVAVTELD